MTNDITYCTRADCQANDCRRQKSKAPIEVYLSWSDFSDCEYYKPLIKKHD